MKSEIIDIENKGYVTRILPDEVDEVCVGCGQKFTLEQKVFRMKKENGMIVQCSKLTCFNRQGGIIDEYQINTVISRKPVMKPKTKQNMDFRDHVISQYDKLHNIEDILLDIEKNKEFSSNGQKLGMYMKMIDDSLKQSISDNITTCLTTAEDQS